MRLTNEQVRKQQYFPFLLGDKPVHIPVDEDDKPEQLVKSPFNLDMSRPVHIPVDEDEEDRPRSPFKLGKQVDIFARGSSQTETESITKKELRRSLCGHRIGQEFKVESGEYYKGTYHCDLWRDEFCPRCSAWRSKKRKRQIKKAFAEADADGRTLKRIVADKKGAKSICAKLTKDEYQRLPQEDGTVVFLVDSEKDISNTGQVEELTWDDLDEIDWDKLVQTPDNQRITGGLGKKASALADDEVEIKAPRFVVHPHTTADQEIEALTETLEETAHLNPQTAEELEAALEERTNVFIAKLKKAGGKLLHRVSHKTIKVRISRISWRNSYTDYMIEDMVHVDNMPPEIPLVA